jgi:hypothetical protein
VIIVKYVPGLLGRIATGTLDPTTVLAQQEPIRAPSRR